MKFLAPLLHHARGGHDQRALAVAGRHARAPAPARRTPAGCRRLAGERLHVPEQPDALGQAEAAAAVRA